MEWKLFLTVFGAIFIAEMTDKTQLVMLLFAADKDVSKLPPQIDKKPRIRK